MSDTNRSLDDIKSDFDRDGIVIVDGIWSEERLTQIEEEAKRLRAELEVPSHIVQNPHRNSDLFLSGFRDERVVSITEKLVGGVAHGLQSQLFLGVPDAEGYAPHQDAFFTRAPNGTMLTFWTALEDVGPENGGLYYYPGSHLGDLFPVDPPERPEIDPDQDPHVARQSAVMPEGKFEKHDVRLTRGQVLIINGYCVHGSYDNTSRDRTRKSFLMTFLRDGTPFRAGYGNKRERIECHV